MPITSRDMVRPVLVSLKGGLLTEQQALDLLLALGIAPRIAGMLLRQSPEPRQVGHGSSAGHHPSQTADPMLLGA